MRRLRRIVDKDRKRVARAYDSCRQHKGKCDGGLPCRRCARLHRQCIFTGRGPGERRKVCTLPDIPRTSGSEPEPLPELLERVTYLERIVKRKITCLGMLEEAMDKKTGDSPRR